MEPRPGKRPLLRWARCCTTASSWAYQPCFMACLLLPLAVLPTWPLRSVSIKFSNMPGQGKVDPAEAGVLHQSACIHSISEDWSFAGTRMHCSTLALLHGLPAAAINSAAAIDHAACHSELASPVLGQLLDCSITLSVPSLRSRSARCCGRHCCFCMVTYVQSLAKATVRGESLSILI